MPVAESARVAALPERPEWTHSDQRWRWRVVAGLWVLVLLIPLPAVLTAVLPPSEPFGPYTFTDAFRYWYLESYAPMIWAPVVFCMGMVLIFSRERGTRPRRLDRVRRWGGISAWVLLPVTALAVSGITLLVIAGIRNQVGPPGDPAFAAFARRFSVTWSDWGFIAMQFLSAGLVLMMGLVLYDALVRCGSKGLARLMVGVGLPLVALQVVFTIFYAAGAAWAEDIIQWEGFFHPYPLANGAIEWYYRAVGLGGGAYIYAGYYAEVTPLPAAGDIRGWVYYGLGFPLELIKFLLLLAIAVQLTFARRHD